MRKSTVPSKPLVLPDKIPERDAVRSEVTRQCPHCGEAVAAEAISCCHCGQDLPHAPKPTGDPWDGYDL